MRVRVESFQSIAAADIEIEGFTAITGRTNLGKSALLRAIAAARFGMPGNHFIRSGANACRVRIDTGDHVLEWQKVLKKREGEETYLDVDGKRNTRFGRDQLSLIEHLGFAEVADLRPQVALQHDPIFLLSETPNAVAEVFRMMGRADVVTSAQESAKRDLTGSSRTLQVRITDSEAAEKQADDLAWAGALSFDFDAWWAGFDQKAAEIERMQNASAMIGECRRFEPVAVPSLQEARRAIDAVHNLYARLGNTREALVLSSVAVPLEPKLPDAPIASLARVQRVLDLRPVCVPDSVAEVGKPPVELLRRVQSLRALNDECDKAVRTREDMDDLVQATEVKKTELEEHLGCCPTCERPFQNHDVVSAEAEARDLFVPLSKGGL